jgi:hypothetical protein
VLSRRPRYCNRLPLVYCSRFQRLDLVIAKSCYDDRRIALCQVNVPPIDQSTHFCVLLSANQSILSSQVLPFGLRDSGPPFNPSSHTDNYIHWLKYALGCSDLNSAVELMPFTSPVQGQSRQMQSGSKYADSEGSQRIWKGDMKQR